MWQPMAVGKEILVGFGRSEAPGMGVGSRALDDPRRVHERALRGRCADGRRQQPQGRRPGFHSVQRDRDLELIERRG